MKASDDLFQLVKSMSKSEKRYCRLSIERSVGKEAHSCLKLFDAIGGQREHDEHALRESLREEPFVQHLSVTKNHLYTLLLGALRAYHKGKAKRAELRDLIESATILRDRGLYGQARKLLARARKLAVGEEFFPELLMIIYQEWQIDSNTSYLGKSLEDLEERRREVAEVLAKIGNLWDYVHQFSLLGYALVGEGPQRQQAQRERYDAIMRHPIFEGPEGASSRLATLFYFDTYSLYYMITANHRQGYEHTARYIRYQEAEYGGTRGFLNTLRNHLFFCIRVEKYQEAEEVYQRICTMESFHEPSPLRRLTAHYTAAMMLYGATYDFEKTVELAPEVMEFCRKHDDGLTQQLQIVFPLNAAYAHLGLGNHHDAAQILHSFINDNRDRLRPDTQSIARIMQLMVHYEMGNVELLPYLWRSAYRYLCRRSTLHRFERILLDFMRKLPAMASRRELVAEFGKLRGEMIALREDPLERELAMSLDIVPWLQSKIEGKKMLDVVRRIRKERRRQAVEGT